MTNSLPEKSINGKQIQGNIQRLVKRNVIYKLYQIPVLISFNLTRDSTNMNYLEQNNRIQENEQSTEYNKEKNNTSQRQ